MGLAMDGVRTLKLMKEQTLMEKPRVYRHRTIKGFF